MTRRAAALALLALLPGCGARREPDLELLRARNALAEGRSDWARIHFERDLVAHPDRRESRRGLALAWLSGYQQSLSQGAVRLREVVALDPDPALARQLVSTLLLLGESEEARQRAGALDDHVESHLLRARAWLEADPSRSLQAARQGLQTASSEPRLHAVAAAALERTGDAAAAREHALRAHELAPLDYANLYRLARLEQRTGAVAEAARHLAVHARLTRLLHDGNLAPLPPDEALALIAELRPLLPHAGGPALRRLELQLLFAASRLDEALEGARALALDPQATVEDLVEAAIRADGRGRPADARRLLDEVLRRDPAHVGAHASLAKIDIEAGRLPQARAHLEAAAERDPHLARVLVLKSRLLLREGRADDSLGDLRRAVELAPWEWPWRLELADAHIARGETPLARRVLADAVETPSTWAEDWASRARDLGPAPARPTPSPAGGRVDARPDPTGE